MLVPHRSFLFDCWKAGSTCSSMGAIKDIRLRNIICVAVMVIFGSMACKSAQELAQEATVSSYCPSKLGTLDPVQNKYLFSQYVDDENREYIYLKSHTGQVVRIRKEFLYYFREGTDKGSFWSIGEKPKGTLEKDAEFARAYVSVCGEFPPFLLKAGLSRKIEQFIIEV